MLTGSLGQAFRGGIIRFFRRRTVRGDTRPKALELTPEPCIAGKCSFDLSLLVGIELSKEIAKQSLTHRYQKPVQT
jgi:hypothetical protein